MLMISISPIMKRGCPLLPLRNTFFGAVNGAIAVALLEHRSSL